MMNNDGLSGAQPLAGAKSGRFGSLNPKLLGLVAAVIVAVIFFFQNGGRTRIWFLIFSFTSKTRTAIIVAMVLGVVLDRLFMRWWEKRKAAKAQGAGAP